MLRITQTNGHGKAATLRLEGKLNRSDVQELLSACQSRLNGDGELWLDLAGVTFMDAAGVDAVRGLIARKIRIEGCSGLIQNLLKGAAQ